MRFAERWTKALDPARNCVGRCFKRRSSFTRGDKRGSDFLPSSSSGPTHALIGVRSVLLDYVHTRSRLVAVDLLVRATAVVLGSASVLAVLKLLLGR
jgi:hypothetical protein